MCHMHARYLAERGAAPLNLQVEWQLVCRGGAMYAAAHLHLAGVGEGEIDVGTHGLGGKAQLPLIRIFQPYRDIGVEKGEGQLLSSMLEIDAGVVGFDIGEAILAPGSRASGRRLLRARGLQQHGGEVPLSVRAAFQVETGLVERDTRDLQAAAPERRDAKRGGHAGALKDRLRTIAGGRIDDEVGDLHRGAGKQLQLDAGDLHRMTERRSERGRYLALVTAD